MLPITGAYLRRLPRLRMSDAIALAISWRCTLSERLFGFTRRWLRMPKARAISSANCFRACFRFGPVEFLYIIPPFRFVPFNSLFG